MKNNLTKKSERGFVIIALLPIWVAGLFAAGVAHIVKESRADIQAEHQKLGLVYSAPQYSAPRYNVGKYAGRDVPNVNHSK